MSQGSAGLDRGPDPEGRWTTAWAGGSVGDRAAAAGTAHSLGASAVRTPTRREGGPRHGREDRVGDPAGAAGTAHALDAPAVLTRPAMQVLTRSAGRATRWGRAYRDCWGQGSPGCGRPLRRAPVGIGPEHRDAQALLHRCRQCRLRAPRPAGSCLNHRPAVFKSCRTGGSTAARPPPMAASCQRNCGGPVRSRRRRPAGSASADADGLIYPAGWNGRPGRPARCRAVSLPRRQSPAPPAPARWRGWWRWRAERCSRRSGRWCRPRG